MSVFPSKAAASGCRPRTRACRARAALCERLLQLAQAGPATHALDTTGGQQAILSCRLPGACTTTLQSNSARKDWMAANRLKFRHGEQKQ